MRILWWIKRLSVTAAFCSVLGTAAQADSITVFAAASLKEALDQVIEEFEAKTGHLVTTSFAGSSALARQIEYGAPADIFISASTDWMDRLAQTGDIKTQTRINLLENGLVLVSASPQVDIVEVTSETDLSTMLNGGRLAMAMTEAVPAGIYGRAALEALGLWQNVEGAIAQTDNVRAALALVTLRAATLGIVYATDAQAETRVNIVGTFPAGSHPPIVYPAALTTHATSPEALALLDYLGSDAAHDVFEAHGFIVTRK